MKKLITLSFTLTFLLFFLGLQAQEIQKGHPGMWPAFIKYSTTPPAFSKSSIAILDAEGKKSNLANGVLKNTAKDANGTEHYRYQQTLNGIAIENAIMLVHVAGGKIKSQNGKWIKDFPSGMQAAASITEANALNKVLQNIGASKYKWEIAAEEAFLKREQNNSNATFFPKAILVYYSGEVDVIPSALRLAYRFDVYAQEPVSRQLIFVDAVDGKFLGKRELIHEANATGTAQTAFSGMQTITTDFTGATYRLRETGRGAGINTYNLQTGTNYAAAVDFTDADNNWNNVNAAKDEYATDAHWGTEMTYDYYLQKFGRNSIDGAGMALNSYLHYNSNYFNAFWDGSRMTYGDGDAAHGNKPLTSLDVCGHEITHGITERTSALVYSYESGAMNEGFSDIFGTAIEAFARPTNTDWLIGGDFFTIRSMSNPNAFNHPDTYQGTFWYSGSGDNGGVHYNSGVLNYWFYLLTVGGNGLNDHNFSFNVTGIGMNKAAAIAYRLNTVYLVPTSEYYDARILGIQAAEDLYGIGSTEAIQTANAFDAVGLYGATCSAVTGLAASPVQDVSATLAWDVMPGAYYYKVQYKLASSSTWLNAATVTNATISLTGLTSSTLYDWRVRASCNATYSSGQFTTTAPVCNAPAGLVNLNSGTTAELSWNAVPYALNYVLEYKLATNSTWTVLTTTTVRTYTLTGLTGGTAYDWRVKTNCSFGSSGYSTTQFTTNSTPCDAPTGFVFTYNNNISTISWNTVAGATEYLLELDWAGAPWPGLYSEVVTTNSWSYTNFMQGAGFQVRVNTNCGGPSSLWSNTFVFNIPCSTPVSQSTTNITTNSATLNWVPAVGNNTNTAFSVSYRLANTTNAWTTLANTTATTANIAGLMPGSTYEWKVTKICSGPYNSNSITTQFTTLGTPCTAPAGLASSGITGSQATVSWATVSGAVSYSVQYKPSTSSVWTASTTSNVISRIITGLAANTLYDWRVMTNCSSNTSLYSAAQFTTSTASGCAVPTGLSVTNISNTTATINWNAVSGAGTYNIYYKLNSSTTWISVNSNTNSYNLNSLAMNGLYQFMVRSVCGVNYSAFSPASTFTTLSCPSWGNNTNQWIDLFSLGTINRTSGADPGGYINTGLITNMVIGSNGNAGQISLGFSGSVQKHNFSIYLDLNRNNAFESTERVVGALLINTSGNVSFSLNIPAGLTPGQMRLRVVARKNTDGPVDPCLTNFLGETEDYLVNLTTTPFNGFGDNLITATPTITTSAITSITVAPNPSAGRYNITFNGDFSPVQYDVLTSNGIAVKSARVVSAKTLQIDITVLPAGLYLLRLTDKSGKMQRLKLLKE